MHQADFHSVVTEAVTHKNENACISRSALDDFRPLPYPSGWFALCLSSTLKPGDLRNVPFMGGELLVYRTSSGQVRAIEPYCPHLGAHLGHGGRVDGENLVCPFHGLSFGQDGVCVGAPYGRRPPRAKLNQWFVCERGGVVLVWRHYMGREPDWEVPEIDADGFSSARESCFQLSGHPHDSPENAADSTHFMWVHQLTHVVISQEIKGHCMEIHVNGWWSGLRARVRMTIYGVGYVCAESELPALGLLLRSCSFGTPTAPSKWTYTLVDRVHVKCLDRFPNMLRRPLYAVVGALMHWLTLRVVRDDFQIWNHRRYVKYPKLMEGEATVAAFRRWMMQFYPIDYAPADRV
jgi:cholesterol 7-desaturase